MKRIYIGVLIILIIGAGYIFIKDKNIKKELANVNQADVVEQNIVLQDALIDSEILIRRVNGKTETFTSGLFIINPQDISFTFTGYKPGGEHIGSFDTIESTVSLDQEGTPVHISMTIDPASVKTDSEKLDEHLQSQEFFDTARYPQILVEVRQFQKQGDLVSAITDLTIKGVTKTLSIPVTITSAPEGVTFAIDTRINISDYKIAYGPVLDEVRITARATIQK